MKRKELFYIAVFILGLCTNTTWCQWQELSTGINYTIFSMSAIDNNLVWACSSGPNIIRTTDGGTTWINVGGNVPTPYGVETCIYAFDVNTAIFACYAGSPTNAYVYKTTNSGANWSLVLSQSPGFITAIGFKSSTQGFIVGWPEGGRWSLWRTNNSGDNWDSTGLYIAESNTSHWSFENAIVYSGSNIWFGARGKGIFYSSNDGANWMLQDLTSGGFPYPSALYFETPQIGYSSAQLNLVKTTNGGINWNVLPGTVDPENITRGVASNINEIWFVRDLEPYIFYSSNNGNNWTTQHSAPSGTGYKYLTRARNGNTLWACTIAGEVAKYTIPLSVKNQSSEIPVQYNLFQNYPNPFNPSTIIKFSIPLNPSERGTYVQLKIYDILGREVVTLINEKLSPGTYEVDWDATNYPSGIYFYKLKAGDFIQTKKMLLLK